MLQILIERALKVNRAFSADRCRILRLPGRCPRLGMKAAPAALTITLGREASSLRFRRVYYQQTDSRYSFDRLKIASIFSRDAR